MTESKFHAKDYELQARLAEKGIKMELKDVAEQRLKAIQDVRAAAKAKGKELTLTDDELSNKMEVQVEVEEVVAMPMKDAFENLLLALALTQKIFDFKRQYGTEWRTKLVEDARQSGVSDKTCQFLTELCRYCPEPELGLNDYLAPKTGVA